MDFKRVLRAGSGPDDFDDRKLPNRILLEVDAALQLFGDGSAPGWIPRRMVVET
jgi:hypothetical protein